MRGLRVGYGGREVAHCPGLRLLGGQLCHLRGDNGAGKTTLLRTVAGEVAPLGGEVRVLGARPGSQAARAATVYVPAEATLPAELLVREWLEFAAALWQRPGGPIRTQAQAFGLTPWLEAWPAELSRGTRQKVALSVALGLGLPLTLLDEPFATLDRASGAALRAGLQAALAGGGAVLVTTHGAELTGLELTGAELLSVELLGASPVVGGTGEA